MESITEKPFNRFDVPVKMGIAIGFIMILLKTIHYMFLADNFFVMMGSMVVFFIINMVLYYITAVQQRKAMGGYISIRQAFSAVFVAILISLAMVSIYNFIYLTYIDPDIIDRMSETSIEFAKEMGASDEKLDEVIEKAEAQKDANNSIGSQVLSFFSTVVLYSIFGFICAAIAKRKKPEHLA